MGSSKLRGPHFAAILLPSIVSACQQDHPDVELSMEDVLAAEALDRVCAGVVDAAVTAREGRPGACARDGDHAERRHHIAIV